MPATMHANQRLERQRDQLARPDASNDIVGVRWEVLMRARDRAADSVDDCSDVLRQVADRLADELNRMHDDSQTRRQAG